jgi:DNA-binding winged helix-turn-helix (wHTH) protein/class 3 adenylate cyclase
MEERHHFGFGPFQLDCRDERLWRGIDVIRVKPKALAVLECLLKSAGRLVTKERLFTTVWPETSVSDAVLTTTIRELRRALGDQARTPHYIETVHGRGYRFVALVNVLPYDPAASLDATAISDDKLGSAAFPDGDIPVATTTPLTGAAHPHPDDAASTAATSILEAERRQLTVMSCDLVDSELLAETFDLEELHEVVRDYQAACVRLIEHFEGYIAQYLGNSLLVYFGHPQAHEDDARRAVRAGLDMLAAVDLLNARCELRHGVRLAMRVGLHTGFVIVEDRQHRGGQGWLTFGAVPDIAIRLQERATPNTLVVSAAT